MHGLLVVVAFAVRSVVAAWTATIAAGSAVAVTTGTIAFATRATFGTGCALRFYPTFGFGKKGTHRQTVFTGLLVDFDEFDFDFVAFFET